MEVWLRAVCLLLSSHRAVIYAIAQLSYIASVDIRNNHTRRVVFAARCTIVQSAVMRSHVVCLSVCLFVCLSVTLVDHDHIGWKSWKRIVRTISQTSSLFVTQRSSTYFQGNMGTFLGENVRSTPTSITSGWNELSSTESRDIGGGVAAGCLFPFVIASRGNLCVRTVFLFYILFVFSLAYLEVRK